MEQLAARAQTCLRQAIKSFNEKDTELARQTIAMAAGIESAQEAFDKTFVQLSQGLHDERCSEGSDCLGQGPCL